MQIYKGFSVPINLGRQPWCRHSGGPFRILGNWRKGGNITRQQHKGDSDDNDNDKKKKKKSKKKEEEEDEV